MTKFCETCGQFLDQDTTEKLWDIYDRISDGRSQREALVYYPDGSSDGWDEDDVEAMKLAMERDMHSRGLCTSCARPDLRGVKEEDVMSEEDARELHEMWAEQAAERRAGC